MIDKEQRYLNYIKKEHPGLVDNSYAGDALKLTEIIKDTKYDIVVMVGLAQYFNDNELRALLTEIKQVLNDDGKVYIKEQHTCSDTALTEKNDWVRSLACFKSAFDDTGFASQLVSRYSWDSKHCENLSFVLKPADVPVF